MSDKNLQKAITNIPGFTSLLGPQDTVDNVSAAYAKVPLLYRAVRIRADALTQVPYVILDSRDDEVDWPFETDLVELLWHTQVSRMLTGASYWLRLRNTTRVNLNLPPQNVIWLNPTSMEVEYDVVNGFEFYQQAGAIRNGPWSLEDIVYTREFDLSQDTNPGIGSAMVALGDAQLANYAIRLAGKYFESGAMPALVVALGQHTSELERKRVQGWFNRKLGGLQSGVRRVLGLLNMPEFHELTPNMKDMVMPELYDLAKKNISIATGVPVTMLDEPGANRATTDTLRLSFWADNVRPEGNLLIKDINRQFLEPMDLRIEPRWEDLDVFQEDEEQRAGSLLSLAQAAALVPAPVFLALANSLGYDLHEEDQAAIIANQEVSREVEVGSTGQLTTAGRSLSYHEAKELLTLERHAKGLLKRNGSATNEFDSEVISPGLLGALQGSLEGVTTVEGVEQVIRDAWAGYP